MPFQSKHVPTFRRSTKIYLAILASCQIAFVCYTLYSYYTKRVTVAFDVRDVPELFVRDDGDQQKQQLALKKRGSDRLEDLQSSSVYPYVYARGIVTLLPPLSGQHRI